MTAPMPRRRGYHQRPTTDEHHEPTTRDQLTRDENNGIGGWAVERHDNPLEALVALQAAVRDGKTP